MGKVAEIGVIKRQSTGMVVRLNVLEPIIKLHCQSSRSQSPDWERSCFGISRFPENGPTPYDDDGSTTSYMSPDDKHHKEDMDQLKGSSAAATAEAGVWTENMGWDAENWQQWNGFGAIMSGAPSSTTNQQP